MDAIAKVYNPTEIEARWYNFWIEHRFFHAEADPDKKPYCIMMPPPNVTGILHMGHALQSTIQDMLIRYYGMRGYSALWMPGTDHAGIATQNVVEKKLQEEGSSREELGREAFIEEVWKWKEKHGNLITEQQKTLGSSCDWERERFTMDSGLSHAVRTVFVKLYEQGLIYKGKYIVNWCPFHRTALSDEEVKHKEHNGSLWYVRYPFAEGEGAITVATTRPETILGDTAVAVNSKDTRYKEYIGRYVTLPILNRKIPVIADDFVDISFGTGAVKVTPAHDQNDFLIGERHGLPQVVVIDESGRMTEEAGILFQGLDRFECRKKLLDELEKQGYLEKTENHTHSIGHCYRCSQVIEPLISDQWFLKMKPLAEKAIKAVRDGEIGFYPVKWEKDYFYWMENIRDWCISRQLWWGHRIPVWYCQECNTTIVAESNPEKCTSCQSDRLTQDEDVLDTWFSSWLWPFSTLNWPADDPDFRYFYPTSVLVSGYEILFFWIARMIMAGLWFTGEKPFKDVYLTGMVKDDLGRIMSKSLGNGIDPLEMINIYGADAVRYSLVALNTEGQDIKLAPSKFEMGRNFANKIWNAYRFLLMKQQEISSDGAVVDENDAGYDLSDRWIISRLHASWKKFEESVSVYRLSDASNTLYAFLWHDFCDWYLEIIKYRLNSGIPGAVSAFRNIALPVFKKTMELLHPIMPFITEEIRQNMGSDDSKTIMRAHPEEYDESLIDPECDRRMGLIQKVVYAIRNIRGEMNVPPGRKADLYIKCPHKNKRTIIMENLGYIQNLARIENTVIETDVEKPEKSATAVLTGLEIFIPLAGLIDIEQERKRLDKEITQLEKLIRSSNKKLANKEFIKKAPPEIVEQERKKIEVYTSNHERLKSNYAALGA
ncbi:valine--tRNA ligase [candidate division KSB1 bacterium]